jgi:hypothetical protein
MLGWNRFGPIPLLAWLVAYGFVVTVVAKALPNEWMLASHSPSAFGSVQVSSGAGLWMFMLLVSTPLPFVVLGGANSLEFLFTRAVDRRVWLRVERVAVLVIAILPLVVNLAVSPWRGKLTVEAGSPEVQAHYLSIFPGSHAAAAESGAEQGLVIEHGTETVAAWLLWAGLMVVFLVAGYFSAVFCWWQRWSWHHSKSKWRPWLGTLMVSAPGNFVIVLFLFTLISGANIYEECFFLFAGHPVLSVVALVVLIRVVQPWTERNIGRLEFEFA